MFFVFCFIFFRSLLFKHIVYIVEVILNNWQGAKATHVGSVNLSDTKSLIIHGMKMKIIQLFTLIFALASFSQVQALENGNFFFETDWGEEVRVEVTGSYNNPKFTIISNGNYDAYEVFKQYVKSTLESRNYQYVITNGCFDCQNPAFWQGAQANTKKTKEPIFSISNVANKLVESVANTIGSRLVTDVADKIASDNSDATTSKFTVVTTKNKDGNEQPASICKITPNSCDTVERVEFSSGGGGSWAVTYPAPVILSEQYDYWRQVEEAIDRYTRNSTYQCKVVYTGSGEDLVASLVCFPSY